MASIVSQKTIQVKKVAPNRETGAREAYMEDVVVPKCVKVDKSAKGADADPFGKQTWCRRQMVFKAGNGKNVCSKEDYFDNEFVEGFENDDTTDSEDEDPRTLKDRSSTSSDKFAHQVQLKKRENKRGGGLLFAAGPGQKLPSDIEVILDDMDFDMQMMVIDVVRQADGEFPDEEEEGALRAKRIKMLLDEQLDPDWHCCVIQDKFWAGCSFQPGYTFAFELGDSIYLVWRTPSARNKNLLA